MRLQDFLAKPCSDFADRLELFGVGVIASEEECAVHVCTLAFAVVAAYNDQVQGITNTCKIIFLELSQSVSKDIHCLYIVSYLQPIDTSPTWLIEARITFKHLDHESFTPVLDTLLQEGLNLLYALRIRRLCKVKLSRDSLKMFAQQFSAFNQWLWE